MAALAQDLLALALTVLLSLVQAAYGAPAGALAADLADGWHSWEVPTGTSGRRACCHNVHGGKVGTTGCRLGGGSGGVTIDSDCEPASDLLRVYVFVADGDVAEIRALSAGCPVEAASPVRDLGRPPVADSIAWLDRHAVAGSGLADDAVVAIALHDDAAAFAALKGMVEDPRRGMDVREQALFWLAHSDNDEAFRYLDRLLSSR